MRNKNGLGLLSMLIALVIIALLISGKTGYLDKWLKQFNQTGSGKTLNQLSGGYVETQIGLGEQAKAQVRDIQKTLDDQYKR